jgi:sigma-B regulation protein RsbU (phosphoserine phosphatase)
VETALQCIEEGVVLVDLEGRFLFVNEAAQEIVGKGPVESSPTDWSSIYGSFLPDKVTPYPPEQLPLARAMRGEHVHEEEVFIRNPERPEGIWISVNSSPLKDSRGELCGGVIVFRDVTAHRRSHELVSKLSQAVERTTDAVFITDVNAIIEYVNPAFEETTGYLRHEAIGQRPSILKSGVHEPGYYEKLWERILSGEVHSGTLVNRKKGGDLYHTEQTITPVRDPTGNLTHFVSVMRDVTKLKRAEEREVEMRLARTVQQKLYPGRSPKLAGFDLAGTAFPADHTCGDYYDFIPMADGRIGIVMGDVSGHGLGAALLMAETRAYLRSLAKTKTDLNEILTQLNALLRDDTEDERFVTLMLVALDPVRKTIVYSSAGHIPGYVLRPGAATRALGATSPPLGILPDLSFESDPEIPLEEGDLLLLLTDGVPEAQSGDEEFFETERVLQVVGEHRVRSSREIIDRLYAAVRAFSDGAPQLDDITAVVARVIPSA